MDILGKGVYSLAEAARLTGLRPARVRDWFRPSAEVRAGRAVFRSDYPSVGGDHAISFLDLIEVYIAGRLRGASPPVSLQRVRKVHEKLALETGVSHPFCTREIYHGGGQIFTRRFGDRGSGPVVEPLTNQLFIDQIIMPFLERIEYHHLTDLATLWHITDEVVVDPARCFGKPVVAAVGVATRVLAGSYEANGRDAAVVADWYGVGPEHVRAAVEFENRAAA